jgi:putative transposase
LTGQLAKKIEGMIRFAAQIHEWEIYELAIPEDHIHLYVGTQPKWSPSEIMQLVKGGTSNKIRDLFPELDEIYWGATFWADGYFVSTVGTLTDKVVSDYVKAQR